MARRRREDSDKKGRLLEIIVARLQEACVGQVTTRARLPSMQDPSRTREIDVLVSVPGPLQDLQVPFECRNWSRKVKPGDIGEFRDKLEDVGLPVPYGIYVTTAGYTQGALERARNLGIQTLLVRGLTADRLRIAVHHARHSTVVVILQVATLQPMDDVTGPGQQFEHRMFPAVEFDERLEPLLEGELTIEHLLWRLADIWCAGGISRRLGVHGGAFRVPDGFKLPRMDPSHSGLIWCNLRVKGIVFKQEGRVAAAGLHDASSGSPRQQRLDWHFPLKEGTERSDLIFDTEEALVGYLQEQEVAFHLVTRVAVPRVQFLTFWWPISPEAMERAKQLRELGQEVTFEGVEHSSVTRGWAEDPRRSHASGREDPEER